MCFSCEKFRDSSLCTLQKLRYPIAAAFLLLLGTWWITFIFHRGDHLHLHFPATGPSSQSPTRYRRPLLVLHWTEEPSLSWFTVNSTTFSDCPVNNCVGTADRSLLLKADAVLIHGLRINVEDLPQRRLPHQRYVFVLRESPRSMSHLPLKRLDGFFNLTMTYSQHADVLLPYARMVDGKQGGSEPPFHRGRSGRPVAWMVSHCNTPSQREQYVSQLRRHIPVDTFGGCGEQHCTASRRDCYRQLAETHLFYLAFENTLCDDYITEKFWLALEVGLVPVVRGPPPEHYRRVAPPHSFIHVEEFAGPKALAGYLLALAQNQTEYDQYHVWRRSYHIQPRLETWSLCALCRRLGRDERDPGVQLSDVWSAENNCRQPRDVETAS